MYFVHFKALFWEGVCRLHQIARGVYGTEKVMSLCFSWLSDAEPLGLIL